jgi:hypothetical protein
LYVLFRNCTLGKYSRLAHPFLAPSLTGYFLSHSQCLVIWSQKTCGRSGSQVTSHGAPRNEPNSVKNFLIFNTKSAIIFPIFAYIKLYWNCLFIITTLQKRIRHYYCDRKASIMRPWTTWGLLRHWKKKYLVTIDLINRQHIFPKH